MPGMKSLAYHIHEGLFKCTRTGCNQTSLVRPQACPSHTPKAKCPGTLTHAHVVPSDNPESPDPIIQHVPMLHV